LFIKLSPTGTGYLKSKFRELKYDCEKHKGEIKAAKTKVSIRRTIIKILSSVLFNGQIGAKIAHQDMPIAIQNYSMENHNPQLGTLFSHSQRTIARKL